MMKKPTPIARLSERFWKKVYKTKNCWFWIGAPLNSGYGKMTFRTGQYLVTHVAWFLAYGVWPPPDKLVLHRCDTPQCVRLDHLFLGTRSENLRDAISKGVVHSWASRIFPLLLPESGVRIMDEIAYKGANSARGGRTRDLPSHPFSGGDLSIQYISFETTKWVWNDSSSSGTTRLVLLCLAAYCNQDGWAFPSLEEIVDATKMSRGSILQAIESLEGLNEILVERHRGRGNTHRYYFRAFMEKVTKGTKSSEKVFEEGVSDSKQNGNFALLKRIREEDNKREEPSLPLSLEPGRPQPKPVKEPKVRRGFQKTFAKREYAPPPKPPETWNWFAKLWFRYVDSFPVGRPEHWEAFEKLYSQFSATGIEDRLSRWIDKRDWKLTAWSALDFLNECALMPEKGAGDIPAIANEE